MAIRINNATDFAGRTYLTVDALNEFIGSLSLEGQTLGFTYSVNGTTESRTVNLSGLVTKSDSAAYITVTDNVIDDAALRTFIGTAAASRIVTTDASGHLAYTNAIVGTVAASGSTAATNIPNETAIRTAIDAVANQAINITAGDGVTIEDGEGTQKIISTNLRIAKLGSATSGFAASYQLQYLSDADNETYTAVDSTTIDIVKDQFIKSATFGWSTANDASGAGWTQTKPASGTVYPCIKLEVYVNENGTSADDTAATPIYIPLADVFEEYKAGKAIEIDASDENAISVKIDGATGSHTIFTTTGTGVALISATTNGLVVADVQAAIDLAVEDEHAKMSAAVIAVEENVEALQGDTSAAVDALNDRIVAVASNAQVAANTLEGEIVALDSKVDGAIATVESNLSTAVSNIETAVKAHTSRAVQMVEEDAVVLTQGTGDNVNLVTATVNANNVVAVYNDEGQIYPDITRVTTNSTAYKYTYTLTADYGTSARAAAAASGTWSVLYTLPLAAYTSVNAGSISYDVTGSAAKTIANGTAADPIGEVETVTVDDLEYRG